MLPDDAQPKNVPPHLDLTRIFKSYYHERNDRYFSFFWVGSYFNDVCCTFHLGQMFIRFLSIIFYIY